MLVLALQCLHHVRLNVLISHFCQSLLMYVMYLVIMSLLFFVCYQE
jgi:hypothetical protein